MPSIGTPEIIIILAIALIVFGPKKLPEIGRSIGQGLRELKKASRDIMDTLEEKDEEDEPEFARTPSTTDSAAPLDTPDFDESPDSTKETKHNAADSDRDT